jgi:putative membrane protein
MRLHRTALALAIAAGLALPPAVMAQQPEKPKPAKESKAGMPATDRKFVLEAAEGSMAEVELGKLAAEKGSSDTVKQFGKRMADDHAKAADEVKQLAQQKNITLPADLDKRHKLLRDRLSKLSGADFDKAYANEMVKDHKKDVAEFKREADRAKDADLKAWAGKTLPTLEDHLKAAQDMQAQVKSAPRATR